MHSQVHSFVRLSLFPLARSSALFSRSRKIHLYSSISNSVYSQYNNMPKKDKTVGLIRYYNECLMNIGIYSCMCMNNNRSNNDSSKPHHLNMSQVLALILVTLCSECRLMALTCDSVKLYSLLEQEQPKTTGDTSRPGY